MAWMMHAICVIIITSGQECTSSATRTVFVPIPSLTVSMSKGCKCAAYSDNAHDIDTGRGFPDVCPIPRAFHIGQHIFNHSCRVTGVPPAVRGGPRALAMEVGGPPITMHMAWLRRAMLQSSSLDKLLQCGSKWLMSTCSAALPASATALSEKQVCW